MASIDPENIETQETQKIIMEKTLFLKQAQKHKSVQWFQTCSWEKKQETIIISCVSCVSNWFNGAGHLGTCSIDPESIETQETQEVTLRNTLFSNKNRNTGD